MKKFSPPQMKEVSFPAPHTPHPTPSFKSGELRVKNNQLNGLFADLRKR
jgi:hypothetical protein